MGAHSECQWCRYGIAIARDGKACSEDRGKELEENGFGVVLDKKRARPLRPRPDRFFVLAGETELEAVH